MGVITSTEVAGEAIFVSLVPRAAGVTDTPLFYNVHCPLPKIGQRLVFL